MTGPGEEITRPRPWRPAVRVKQCCRAVLVRERCDCSAVRRQIRRAPVLHVTARRAA